MDSTDAGSYTAAMPEGTQRRLTTIVAADIAGFSRLIGIDEEGTLAAQRGHRTELIEPLLAEYHGRIANTAGDSFLFEFASAVEAVRCAVAVQEGMVTRNGDIPDESRIEYRIGINVGDVIADGDDLLGDGVNIAARLEGLADPGCIYMSHTARDQIRDRLEIELEDPGDIEIKNITRPVRVWRWSSNSELVSIVKEEAAEVELSLPDKPSIAVLAFDNMSGDPEQEYFSDGITEDIITSLSRNSGFFVIARNSSFTYKGRAVDVTQVSRELGVRYVLEGSVRKAGNRIRITAQLIDGISGDHIWAEKYDRDLDDIFELQDEISLNIVSSIGVPIFASEAKRTQKRAISDLSIWDLQIRAIHRMYGFTSDDIVESRRLGEEMLERDPNSAFAMAWIANCHFHEFALGYGRNTRKMLGQAVELIRQSIGINEENSISHWIKGNLDLYFLSRHGVAIGEFERSLELNPNNHLAHGSMGAALAYCGKADEGIEHIKISMRADPRNPGMFFRFNALAQCHFVAGRYQQALECCEKSQLRRSDSHEAMILTAVCQSQLGHLEAAQVSLQEWRETYPNMTIARIYKPPFQNAGDLDRYLDGLRQAGLPE
ncbi:MAG: hypothetical protein HN732_17195 [Rhodospirillaceae bacterium]|nr:hypothetical protein [Rhodospirillaceae bacterium]MBT5897316.1 hypothetical protein [Rhodospirillaceae bacterium]MBT7759069.1 hypothetical protein [Rhodospirillaceae bacterium]